MKKRTSEWRYSSETYTTIDRNLVDLVDYDSVGLVVKRDDVLGQRRRRWSLTTQLVGDGTRALLGGQLHESRHADQLVALSVAARWVRVSQ